MSKTKFYAFFHNPCEFGIKQTFPGDYYYDESHNTLREAKRALLDDINYHVRELRSCSKWVKVIRMKDTQPDQ